VRRMIEVDTIRNAVVKRNNLQIVDFLKKRGEKEEKEISKEDIEERKDTEQMWEENKVPNFQFKIELSKEYDKAAILTEARHRFLTALKVNL
jgi:hypothetical protein